MNPERIFAQLGMNSINAIMIMDTLNVGIDELAIPQRMAKLQEVIRFFKQFPEDTQRFLINKAVRGKAVDKLDHLFEYARLLEDKMRNEAFLEEVLKEKSVLETSDDIFKIHEIAQKELDLSNKIDIIRQEIEIYEK